MSPRYSPSVAVQRILMKYLMTIGNFNNGNDKDDENDGNVVLSLLLFHASIRLGIHRDVVSITICYLTALSFQNHVLI